MKNLYIAFFLWLCNSVQAQDVRKEFRFDQATPAGGSEAIWMVEPEAYDPARGYGFDLNTEADVQIVRHKKVGVLQSDKPFYFSVKVPEGNYRVTLLYSGGNRKAYSTVRSESRRLHLQRIPVPKKKESEQSFIVHVKSPVISPEKSVRLKKPREVNKLDWDDKLTLEFQGENRLRGLRIERVSDVHTVFLAGNSTVVNQEDEPWASWGQMIPRFFNTGVAVANHAESGLSLGSFLSSNRLEKILAVAHPGDYLFIEFGHNDQKEKGENDGAFKSYAERLRLYVNSFREKGGVPVILTSTARRAFGSDGVLQYTLGDYPEAARQVAAALNVPLIDLNKMTRSFYETLGVEGSKNALVHYPAYSFPNQTEALQDNTHFNTYGAYQIAKMVLQGIIDNDLHLQKYMIDFSGYDPQRPDLFSIWHWPQSLINSVVKPDGN